MYPAHTSIDRGAAVLFTTEQVREIVGLGSDASQDVTLDRIRRAAVDVIDAELESTVSIGVRTDYYGSITSRLLVTEDILDPDSLVVSYIDEDRAEQTIPNTEYFIDETTNPSSIRFLDSVSRSLSTYHAYPVKVSYNIGVVLGTTGRYAVEQAMVMAVRDLYDPSGEGIGRVATDTKRRIEDLVRPFSKRSYF